MEEFNIYAKPSISSIQVLLAAHHESIMIYGN